MLDPIEGYTPPPEFYHSEQPHITTRMMPKAAYSLIITRRDAERVGKGFMLLTLLGNLRLHWSWGAEYPTKEKLAMLQEQPMNMSVPPASMIDNIYRMIPEALFNDAGLMDARICVLFRSYGYSILKTTNPGADEYVLRHQRGDMVFYGPEE